MKAYVALSFKHQEKLMTELKVIDTVLQRHNITSWIFVNRYKFTNEQEKEMMHQAMQDIDSCHFLIAETTYKGIGIGVEAGYAKAKNKPVIYMRNKNASHSTTVAGISDFEIIYTNNLDLEQQLEIVLKQINKDYDIQSINR